MRLLQKLKKFNYATKKFNVKLKKKLKTKI